MGSTLREGVTLPPSPSSLVKYFEEGSGALKGGDAKKAARLFTKALRSYDNDRDPTEDLATVYCGRSMAQFQLKDYDAAQSDAAECIRLRPYWSKGHFRMAEAQFETGNWEQALQSYKKAQESVDSTVDAKSLDIVQLRILKVEELMNLRDSHLILRPLCPGRELCRRTFNPIKRLIFEFARGMQNVIYLVGNRQTATCMIVDPCWDVDGIMEEMNRLNLQPAGCIVTHNHFDHYGGKPPPPFGNFGIHVSGVKTILQKYPNIPVYIHEADADAFQGETNIDPTRISTTFDGQELWLGESGQGVCLKFIHTPGHTPGAQCILISDNTSPSTTTKGTISKVERILTGDTLFLGSCGRMDLPGGCPVTMYHTLQHRLAVLPDTVRVYPGHSYGGSYVTSIGRERQMGVLRGESLEEWLRIVTGISGGGQNGPNGSSSSACMKRSSPHNNNNNNNHQQQQQQQQHKDDEAI